MQRIGAHFFCGAHYDYAVLRFALEVLLGCAFKDQQFDRLVLAHAASPDEGRPFLLVVLCILQDGTLVVDVSFAFEASFDFLILVLLDTGDKPFIECSLIFACHFFLLFLDLLAFCGAYLLFFLGLLHFRNTKIMYEKGMDFDMVNRAIKK